MAILKAASEKEWNALTPVASGILAERRRLRELYVEAEKASGKTYIEKIERFRQALGL